MATHDNEDIIRVGDIKMVPAKTEGASNVFSPTPFILTRTRWIPDSEASSCALCNERFTQVRRRHHCRVCGKVLCAKCCYEKIQLPQYGEEEPARVCNYCFSVSSMIAMARSLQMAPRLEAAKGLAEVSAQQNELKKVVESGGVQALIHLAQTNIHDVKEAVVEGLNTLALYPPLHAFIVQCGGIKAICSILSSTNDSNPQILIKGLSTLKLLSKSDKSKILVVAEGALTPLMALSMAEDITITVLSLTTLGIVLENQVNVTSFIEHANKAKGSEPFRIDTFALFTGQTTDNCNNSCGFKNALQTILRLTKSNDEKIQEVSLRVLALVSFGTAQQQRKLIEEDNYAGKCILNAIRQRPKNLEVFTNGSCLIANLAAHEENQSSLMDCIELICKLITSHSENCNIQTHVARAVANFSKHKENGRFLISHLPEIIRVHVNSSEREIRAHGIRSVFYLLEYQSQQTISILIREGIAGLLNGLLRFSGTLGAVREALLKHVPEMSRPM